MPTLDDLNCQMFRDSLNSQFEVHPPSGASVALQLTEVNEKQDTPALEQFSLLFRGPLTPVLEQRTHRFEHPALGRREMFVVPTGRDSEGTLYEVIFNRLRSKGK